MGSLLDALDQDEAPTSAAPRAKAAAGTAAPVDAPASFAQRVLAGMAPTEGSEVATAAKSKPGAYRMSKEEHDTQLADVEARPSLDASKTAARQAVPPAGAVVYRDKQGRLQRFYPDAGSYGSPSRALGQGARGVFQGVGLTAGGAIDAATGGASMGTGSTMGLLSGEHAADQTFRSLGGVDPRSGKDIAGGDTATAAFQATGNMLGAGALAAARPMVAPLALGFQKAKAGAKGILDWMEGQGIPTNPGMVVQPEQTAVEKSIAGAAARTKAILSEHPGAQALADIEALGKADTVDPLGAAVRAELTSAGKAKGPFWEALGNRYKTATETLFAPLRGQKLPADQTVTALEGPLRGWADMPGIGDMLNPKAFKLYKNIKTNGGQASIDQLNELRMYIGDAVNDTAIAGRSGTRGANLKMLYGAVTGDIETALGMMDSAAPKVWQTVKQEYSRGSQMAEFLGKFAEGPLDSAVVPTVIKELSPELTRDLASTLRPQTFDAVVYKLLAGMGEEKGLVAGMPRDWNVEKFLSLYSDMDPRAKATALRTWAGQDTQQKLDKMLQMYGESNAFGKAGQAPQAPSPWDWLKGNVKGTGQKLGAWFADDPDRLRYLLQGAAIDPADMAGKAAWANGVASASVRRELLSRIGAKEEKRSATL